MLTRAARRRHALRHVEQAAKNLQLPWLCPALSSVTPSATQRRTTTTRPLLPRSQTFPAHRPPIRRLASAASITDEFDRHDDYLPFVSERYALPLPSRHVEATPSFDLSKILMIDQTTATTPPRSVSSRSIDTRGGASEVEAIMEASMQLQDWKRAFQLLRQLSVMYIGNSSKLQGLYNRFLEAMVYDLITYRNTANQGKINDWIEVHMARAGVEPNAQTIALKIKVALATLDGSRRDRTVARYWELAKEYQSENQVASLRHILSDNDLGRLSEICPNEVDFEPDLEPEIEYREITAQSDVVLSSGTQTIRETDQKGLGMVSLRQALALFREEGQSSTKAEVEAAQRYRQIRLEQDSLQSAVDRWRNEHEKRMKMGVAGNVGHGRLGALTWQWHEALAKKIEEEIESVRAAESNPKQTAEERLQCEYGPFLRLLSPQQSAALTTIAVVQTMSKIGVSNTVKLSRIVTEVGRAFEEEVEAQKKKNKKSVKKAKFGDTTPDRMGLNRSAEGPILHTSNIQSKHHWSSTTLAKLGAVLCERLFDLAKLPVTKEDPKTGKPITIREPVFQQQVQYVHGRRFGTICLHQAFKDLLVKQPTADLIAKQLPMVSKPNPWTGFDRGGYLESIQPVLRVKYDDSAQRDYAKAAAERGDLDQIFAGLDVLGSTGWKINRDVFDVMLKAWNSGEAIANLPPLNKVFPEIEKPADTASAMEKWQYFNRVRMMENEKGGLHSNRCFQNFQMEIAKSYLDETFYLPHNMDFRGRAYPIPPYLNQMGADNARGLLLFAQGRELGPQGLKWVQVHLANVFGYDKASLSDRAQFALDHIEDVRDSVHNPLNGKRWWLKAEDPWQCLATCHEFLRALESPDPAKHISYLPIHQDGTCNGLQHYAALGGDIAGARQVNLEPGDKPADVYTGVAELVKAEIKQDAEQGLEIAQLLEGRITRKIVKQTVMTNVYGVTFTGAIRQVRKQVDDILPDINQSGRGTQAATYIARKIFKGLGTLFNGAHEIQYWLGDCANRITHSISPAQLRQLETKEFGNRKLSDSGDDVVTKPKKKTNKVIDYEDFRSTVIWTTPLKLPVVQPYRMSRTEQVQTAAAAISLVQPSVADGVHHRKQLQGFPPNFVHSLDATHMMLSALKAHELGLSFSAVHDSFWTHAADVQTLNSLLRDAFIRMHSEDIISRLAAEFEARYKGHWYLAKISRNNDLCTKITQYRANLPGHKSNVGQQRYIELVREIKRMRLLASEDSAERAEGKSMITAASLFEKYGGDKYLPSKVSLGQTAIGETPAVDPTAVEQALQAESTEDVDLENALDPLLEEDPVEEKQAKSKDKKRASNNTVWVWLPLTFRAVPAKGEFKVQNIKDSTYFFS